MPRRAAASPRPKAAWAQLPDDVLQHVFSQIKESKSKKAVMLTCKRFHAIASVVPSWWEELKLGHGSARDARNAVAKEGAREKRAALAFVARKLPLVRTLSLGVMYSTQGLALGVLRMLGGRELESLSVQLISMDYRKRRLLLKHLGGLSGLRRLHISTSGHFDYGTTVRDLAFLARLPNLEGLHLGMLFLDELPASTFAALPTLTSLHLESVFDPAPALRALPGLRRLAGRGLHMSRDTWAAVAAMAQLTSLSLADVRGEVRGMGALRALRDSLAALHLTTGWSLSGELLGELGPLLGAAAPAGPEGQLPGAPPGPAAPEAGPGEAAAGGGGAEAAWGVAAALTGLQCLSLGKFVQAELPELAPGGLSLLTRLRLSGAMMLRTLPASWCRLPALAVLEVESCESFSGLPVAAVTGLTALRALKLSHQRMPSLPCNVRQLSGLTRLAISACTMRTLPAGPYLSSLRELSLFANAFARVPRALRSATALRSLDLSMNLCLKLEAADLQTLACLSSTLRTLDLSTHPAFWRGEEVHERWRAALPGLRRALPNAEVLGDG